MPCNRLTSARRRSTWAAVLRRGAARRRLIAELGAAEPETVSTEGRISVAGIGPASTIALPGSHEAAEVFQVVAFKTSPRDGTQTLSVRRRGKHGEWTAPVEVQMYP